MFRQRRSSYFLARSVGCGSCSARIRPRDCKSSGAIAFEIHREGLEMLLRFASPAPRSKSNQSAEGFTLHLLDLLQISGWVVNVTYFIMMT